jgi:elongation factor Tu
MDWHVIEARIRYLKPSEGGRRTGVASGYRGQFFYDDDYDGFQLFPDVPRDGTVELGSEVRAFVQFAKDRWNDKHERDLHEGMAFKIREGRRTVGEGIVTRLDVPETEWRHLLV